MGKRSILAASIGGVLSLALVVCLVLMKFEYDKKYTKDNNNIVDSGTEQKINDIFVVISINPKLMLKINDNKIIEVYQLNDESIIYTNDKLQGLDIEQGIEKIIKVAKEKNYIKEDTVVKLALYEKSDVENDVLDVIQNKFTENKINVSSYDMKSVEREEIKKIVTNYKEETIKYSITFNTDGGNNIENQKVVEGKKITKPKEPTKEGFKFLGWYLEDKEFDFNTQVNKDITINAKWEEIMTIKEETKEEEIQYAVKEQQEVNMLKGTRNVIEQGKNGKKNVKYKITYNSKNEEVAKEKISEEIIEEAVAETVKVGSSDYNLNSDTYSTAEEQYCLIEDIIDIDGNHTLACADVIVYVEKIVIDNKTYSYLRDVGNITNSVKYEDGKMIYNGKTYENKSGSGSAGKALTQDVCDKYNLTCGKW